MSLGNARFGHKSVRKENKMTIRELRKFYPHHEFYFFKNEKEVANSPFYNNQIKGFKVVNDNTVFVYL